MRTLSISSIAALLSLFTYATPASAQDQVIYNNSGCRMIGRGATIVFEGCNVQVNNGAGTTDTKNGLGNVIVGYNATETGATDLKEKPYNTTCPNDGSTQLPRYPLLADQ